MTQQRPHVSVRTVVLQQSVTHLMDPNILITYYKPVKLVTLLQILLSDLMHLQVQFLLTVLLKMRVRFVFLLTCPHVVR
jgi:hypothetical protein